MKKTMSFCGVLLGVISLYGSSAMALDPLGPPVAGLTQGQFRAGLEYFYEDSEIALYNGILAGGILPPFKMNVKEHMVTANIGYGIHDRWEAFFRIGAEVSGDATGGLLATWKVISSLENCPMTSKNLPIWVAMWVLRFW